MGNIILLCINIVTLLAFVILAFFFYNRLKRNSKRFVIFLAIILFAVNFFMYLASMYYMEHTFLVYRYALKSSAYALLFGAFVYIAKPIKNVRKLTLISLVLGFLYLLTHIIGVNEMGLLHTNIFLIGLLFYIGCLASMLCNSTCVTTIQPVLFFICGIAFMLLEFYHDIQMPGIYINGIAGVTIGALFVFTSSVLFYGLCDFTSISQQ